MKQEIKKLIFLFLLMNLFTSSQEKAYTNSNDCAYAPVITEKIINTEITMDTDSDLPLMPISKFILLP